MWHRCLYLHWSLITVCWSAFLSKINTYAISGSGSPQRAMVSSSFQINFTCGSEVPPEIWAPDRVNPSVMHNLRAELISTEKGPMLNISWAVKVDASIRYLVGLSLQVTTDQLWCQYNPPFSTSNVSKWGVDELWFSYLVDADPKDYYFIMAHNLPEPPYGSGLEITKTTQIETPGCDVPIMMNHFKCKHTGTTRKPNPTTKGTLTEPSEQSRTSWMVALPIILLFIIGAGFYYRQILASFSKRTAELIPTTVLIVYPAVDSVFQRAVLTLADFLQSSGVCSVAIDEWQRGCLAKLGTLRWLHTVSESSDRVLIVLPGHATGLDESAGKLLTSYQVGHTVPASAYELYPLALKMLSHSKTWVVHLGKTDARSDVPVELRGCRSFTLLEDLQKLLHGLCTRHMATGAPWLRYWLGGGKQKHSDKALDKLKEVVEQLQQWEQSKGCKEETLQVVTV